MKEQENELEHIYNEDGSLTVVFNYTVPETLELKPIGANHSKPNVMKLSDQFNRTLKVIDASATNYLTSCCAIMYEEQKELLRAAILYRSGLKTGANLRGFMYDFDPDELASLRIEDKVFLVEQFERFFNGNKEAEG